MSEGEFKKRITEKFAPPPNMPESTKSLLQTLNDVENKAFFDIVDEARKDFPLADWEIKGWLDKDSVMEYLHSEQVKELINWFLNWFGHDEK